MYNVYKVDSDVDNACKDHHLEYRKTPQQYKS